MRTLTHYGNILLLLFLSVMAGTAILTVCFVNSTASAAELEPDTFQLAPLNPAFVAYMNLQQNTFQKGASLEPNYGYVPPTVDLSHIERLRTPQN